ncbi:MAG TPA: HgcAB-associated protein [Candidatus Anoxymicrobiaceae bacterium]|jgi:antitoxin PrlF
MPRKQETCCEATTVSHIESILGIDERGQMVLPKDLRNRAGIAPGDKFAVVSHEKDGEVCCITLIKIESLNEMVKGVLGPVMKDVIA